MTIAPASVCERLEGIAALTSALVQSGAGLMRVKIEINTYETSPARPHRRATYGVESGWWSGSGEVLTFQPEELVATKLRALFQRKKGRDLFDLWLALTVLGLNLIPPRSWLASSRIDPTATPPSEPGRASMSTWSTSDSETTSSRCCARARGLRPRRCRRAHRWCPARSRLTSSAPRHGRR